MDEKFEKIAIFLEKHSYAEIKSRLDKLKKENDTEYMIFLTVILNQDILMRISRNKVLLSKIIEDGSTAQFVPEDRSRLVLQLAKSDFDLNKTNEILANEFGNNFKLSPTYKIKGKIYSWKVLAQKAKEIKQGLYNYCYLSSQERVAEILSYFKIFQNNSITSLRNIDESAGVILNYFNSNQFIIPSSPSAKQIIEMLTNFYKLTNRINLDIEKIKEEVDFSKEIAYVLTIRKVVSTKLMLASKNIPLDNVEMAERILLQDIGRAKFIDLLSAEEMDRFGNHLNVKTIVQTNS